MTKKELAQAVEVAKSKKDLSGVDMEQLDGYGLPDFKKVYTTIDVVARVIRWQCGRFDGSWDMCELDELAQVARTRFIIIG